MVVLLVLLILFTCYVVSNEKIESSNRFGWCAILAFIGVLYLIFGILL